MLLKSLSELNGTSGAETLVRDFLRQQIEPFVETINVDKIGNLIAHEKRTTFRSKGHDYRSYGRSCVDDHRYNQRRLSQISASWWN